MYVPETYWFVQDQRKVVLHNRFVSIETDREEPVVNGPWTRGCA
jgi:hypothetical protein